MDVSLELQCINQRLNQNEIIEKEGKRKEIREMLNDRGMFISALGAHGNPVHPDEKIAKQHHKQFEETVLAAEKLGVDTVLVMSGCPGGSPRDETPNWVTTAWPEDFQDILRYQWEDVLIPIGKRP